MVVAVPVPNLLLGLALLSLTAGTTACSCSEPQTVHDSYNGPAAHVFQVHIVDQGIIDAEEGGPFIFHRLYKARIDTTYKGCTPSGTKIILADNLDDCEVVLRNGRNLVFATLIDEQFNGTDVYQLALCASNKGVRAVTDEEQDYLKSQEPKC